jgi:malonate transporter
LITPLVVYGLCVLLGLNHIATVCAVICAAVPTAKSAYVLASVYHVEETVTGSAISITTLLSIVTLLGWLYVLG